MSIKGEIILEDLSKNYADHTVVNKVSMAIPAGGFFSLLGPSGSGKTSTLMMIAGFSTPASGRVLLDGQDITHDSPQQRGLGMVFQNYALFPHMSIAENVAFPLQVRRWSRNDIQKQVRWALEVVQLSDYAERMPRQLSGGQQQRVALARAIVFEPKVVLMDEPLGALDKNLRYHMQVELKDIQQRLGTTVIYVTHDQEEAMNMSDQIAIMDRGHIVQMGAPREVYENPRNRFVACFLGEANLIPAGLVAEGLTAQNSPSPSQLIFVRPEGIHLRSPTAADSPVSDASNASSAVECRLRGKVDRVSFLGGLIRYRVAIGQEQFVTADQRNVRGHTLFEKGQAVDVSWLKADARNLGDD